MYPTVKSSTALTTAPSNLLNTSLGPDPDLNPTADDPDVYSIKTIQFLNREVTIIMQNMNGPCPLLAIANTLLLRGTMKNIQFSTISNDRLLHLVADVIIESNSSTKQNPNISTTNNEEEQLLGKNIQHNMESVMADTLPILKNGRLLYLMFLLMAVYHVSTMFFNSFVLINQ